MITQKAERIIINISAVIFMTNTVVVPILAWHVNINLLKVLSLSSMALCVMLLLFVSMCKVTKPKECYTNPEYNSLKSNFAKEISCHVRGGVFTCFHKVLEILSRRKVTPQITQSDDTTDNHTLHDDNLAQGKDENNHKQTEPMSRSPQAV